MKIIKLYFFLFSIIVFHTHVFSQSTVSNSQTLIVPKAFFGKHSFGDINMKMIDMTKAELKKINSISLQPKSITLKAFNISIGDMNLVEPQKGNKLSKQQMQKIQNLNVGQFVIIKNLQTNDTNKINPVLVGALVIKVVR